MGVVLKACKSCGMHERFSYFGTILFLLVDTRLIWFGVMYTVLHHYFRQPGQCLCREAKWKGVSLWVSGHVGRTCP
jgi:hypothetical protein